MGSAYDGSDLERFAPQTTWGKRRFILPRRCYVTGKWSGFFPVMYVGTRRYPWTRHTSTWLVSPEEYLFRKLKGEDIILTL